MGTYPDGPSRRMPWDADGSVCVWGLATQSDPLNELSPSGRVTLNDESDSYMQWGTQSQPSRFVYIIFPELRELDGIFASYNSDGQITEIASSQNTTNGIDGTWTQQIANLPDFNNVYASFRDNITSLAVPTEKAIRIRVGGSSSTEWQRTGAIHLYGGISPGETPDRILFLDTLNADAVFTKPINWNEIPRGQTQTRSFKIKNNSAGLTINTIQVTAEDLYLNAGDWYTFGDDDVNFQATFAVGNLGPGATKLLYLKQIVPGAETLGLHTGRIKVVHDSLT